MTLQDTRRAIRRLLDERSAADAPTAYYALHHPPARTALFIEEDARGRAVGFVARCQTGLDLFRPLVTMRCPAQDTSAEGAARLLDRALTPGRPYLLFVPESQYPLAGGSVQVESERVLRIYRLDRARFKPVINVMVMQRTGQDGAPRYEVRSGGVQAVAGVNWQSPGFAEIYVHTEPGARQRGWGQSVVAACTERVLRDGRTPLYLVDEDNEASRALAENVGYVDTGARQVYAEVIYTGSPLDDGGGNPKPR